MSPVPNRAGGTTAGISPTLWKNWRSGRGISPEEMAAHTWNNGLRLFGLEGKV